MAPVLTTNIQLVGFAVLGWQNTCESVEDINATLAALSTEIDLSVLYRGLDPNSTRRLVSVVQIFEHINLNILYILYIYSLL